MVTQLKNISSMTKIPCTLCDDPTYCFSIIHDCEIEVDKKEKEKEEKEDE